VVEDEADAGLQPLGVECLGALEPDLLLRREQELDAGMRTVLGQDQGTASSIAATAALLSAPRIVPPAFRTIPSSTTGSSGPVG